MSELDEPVSEHVHVDTPAVHPAPNCAALGRGPGGAAPPGHPLGPEPYDAPHPPDDGVGADPHGGFRFGTRGHDPDPHPSPAVEAVYNAVHPPAAVSNLHAAFAFIGPLKRAWEYLAQLKQFANGVDALGLADYLRSVSASPGLLTDPVVEELAGPGVTAGMNMAQLAMAMGVANTPECIVLELLKRAHHNSGLGGLSHCK